MIRLSLALVVLNLVSATVAEDESSRDVVDAVVWMILFVVFLIQTSLCLRYLVSTWRNDTRVVVFENETSSQEIHGVKVVIAQGPLDSEPSTPNDRFGRDFNTPHHYSSGLKYSRSPYFALLISLLLSLLAAIYSIITGLMPFPKSLGFSISQIALQTILDGFPVVYLYGAITLFLRDRLRVLKLYARDLSKFGSDGARNPSPAEAHSNTYHLQTVLEALLFSLILSLDGSSAILQALLLKNSGVVPQTADNVENDVTFWAAYAFRILTSVELHISSYLAYNSLKKYEFGRDICRVDDQVVNIIYKAVAPFYTANTFSTFILKVLSIENRMTPTFVVDLLSNTFYVLAISCLLWRLPVPFQFVKIDSKSGSAPSGTAPAIGAFSETDPSNAENNKCLPPQEVPTRDDETRMKTVAELLEIAKPSTFSDIAWLELFKHYKKREEEAEKDFFHKDMLSDSQVFSTLSVVTVFLATISVSLIGIARDTYSEVQETNADLQSIADLGASRLSPSDNVFSCFYLSAMISLMAACVSGLASAIRSLMARNIRNFVSQETSDGKLDRALKMAFIFSCLMMGMAVITLILGLIFFVYDNQPVYVSVAMNAPCCVFVLAITLAVFFHAYPDS